MCKTESQFFNILLHYRYYYFTAILLASLSFLCSFTVPVVIKNIIDIILTDQTLDVSGLVLWIIDLIGGKEALAQNLWLATLAIIMLWLLYAIFTYFAFLLMGLASEHIIKDLRDRLFAQFQRLPYSFFSKEKTGDLIQRCTSDVMAASSFLSFQLTEIGRMLVMVLFLIPYMFLINVKMALLSLTLTPLIAGMEPTAAISRASSRRSQWT